MKESTKQSNILQIVLHSIAWLLLIIIPQIIINRSWGSNNFISWGFYLGAFFYGIIFYLNYLWLIPQFYFKQKKTLYFLFASMVIVAIYFVFNELNMRLFHDPERDRLISEAFEKVFKDKGPGPQFKQIQVYNQFLISIIITGFSLGLRVIEQQAASEKRQKELEKEKLNSELAFLKNQVSPHFFFNTLNNIYSLIGINPDDAQEAVLKLSKLMRYLLYESEHNITNLDNEVSFMTHYIDLMQLRLSKKVELKVDLPSPGNKLEIPPLLFIPFIENAFKHGLSYREKSFIHISMNVEGNKIRFICNNSLNLNTENSQVENHFGIGLENVKKRLNLLFPNKHSLSIDKTDTEYRLSLEIEI